MIPENEASRAEATKYLGTLTTGFIVDALNKIDLHCQGTAGIYLTRGFEDAHIAGPVVTIKFAPLRHTGTDKSLSFFDALKEFKAGSVICIQASPHIVFSGDIQVAMAKRAGMVGMILDGGIRDISGLHEVGMPILARHPATRTWRPYFDLVGINVPIELGGVQTRPGDFVVADENGAVVVPEEVIEQAAELGRYVADVEEQLVRAVKNGVSHDEIATLYAAKGAKVPIRARAVHKT